jgi:hypothetical protein
MKKVLAVLLFFAIVISSLPTSTHASCASVMAKENHIHPWLTHFKGKKPPKKKEQNKQNEDKKKQEEKKSKKN